LEPIPIDEKEELLFLDEREEISRPSRLTK